MRRIRFFGALRVFAAASGLAMGGMAAGAAAKAAPVATPVAHTVTIENTAFSVADLTVTVGDTVTWVNKDPYPHTATSKAGGFDSGDVAPDKSWKLTAKKKGEFPYICTIHPAMKGIVRVK